MIFGSTSILVIIAVLAIAVLFLANLVRKQKADIDFYEKQGVRVYPGARNWVLGNIGEMGEYEKARLSDTVVEVPFKWLLLNINKFVGKKGQDLV